MSDLSQLSNSDLQTYYRLYKSGLAHTKRFESVKVQGMDTKFLYHIVRLLDEIEQILTIGDIDLTRDRERLKAIRRGEWTLEQIEAFFEFKNNALEEMYEKSTLPWGPNEEGIKQLLLDCLEEYYGSLEGAVSQPDKLVNALRQIRDISNRVKL